MWFNLSAETKAALVFWHVHEVKRDKFEGFRVAFFGHLSDCETLMRMMLATAWAPEDLELGCWAYHYRDLRELGQAQEKLFMKFKHMKNEIMGEFDRAGIPFEFMPTFNGVPY